MLTYHDHLRRYLEAVVGARLGADRWSDDRGEIDEKIVLIGVGLVATAAVAGVLWGILRSGAESVQVPAPAAP